MTDTARFAPAFDALAAADEAVRELHEGCCQPLRSPRMEHLARTIDAARDRLGQIGDDPKIALQVVDILHDAGAQLGYLQVACCAPARMKLYATTLESLSKTQRLIKRTFDLEH